MAENTEIAWCDSTFNPWIGCTKVSPGCANCYAERDFDHRKHVAKWGAGQPRHRTSEPYWRQPLKWDRIIAEAGPNQSRPRVFCASLADWLDPEVPIEWLADLLALIQATPHLDWLLLTKRPQNWHERVRLARNYLTMPNAETALWLAYWLPKKESAGMPARGGTPPANVWIGTTVEDQARADERIPSLLSIPARVRFLSCEPLLGPVDLSFGNPKWRTAESYHSEIHWVICGGESGPHARPMHPDWARALRDQCAAAHVPFLFKQWGESLPRDQVPAQPLTDLHNGTLVEPAEWTMPGKGFQDCPMLRVGKHAAGRLLDGREHNEFPEVRS